MKVCLDAGHGYNTPGKRTPNNIREAEQNYAVMEKVGKYFKLNGIDVEYTNRDINYDMPLIERSNFANEVKADLFISIHKNAIGNVWQTKAKGIETYCYSFGSKEETKAEKIAKSVQKVLIEKTKMKNRGVKVGDFHVLRETEMPAILVELGFMDCKEEAEQMRNDAWHEKFGKAICKGVTNYLGVDFIETDWKKEMLEKATNNLLKKELIKSPEYWKNKNPREYGELWFLMTMYDRITD